MFENNYYSQCQPGTGTTTTTSKPATGSPPPSGGSSTGLDAHFKNKGKIYWGTASDQNRFSDATDSAVTVREFGQVTPENSMKWDAVCGISLM